MKKLFKRSVSLILIVCLAFVMLCGCGGTGEGSSSATTSSEVSSQTDTSSVVSSSASKPASKPNKTASKSSQTSKSSTASNTSSEKQTSSEAELIIPDINPPIYIPVSRYTEWCGTMDAASFLLKNGIEAEGKIMVDFSYIFDDGEERYDGKGIVKVVINKHSLINAVAEIYTDMLNVYLTENNLTREDLLVMLDATLDSYIEYFIQQKAKEAVKKMNLTIKTCYYEFVAGVLYMKNQGDQYFRAVEHSYNKERTQMTLTDEGETFVLNRKE